MIYACLVDTTQCIGCRGCRPNRARFQDNLQPTMAYRPLAANPGTVNPAADVAICAVDTVDSTRDPKSQSRQFGQYRLKRRLGAGRMGEVYETEHLLLGRPCAVKLMRPTDGARATSLALFEREVRATALEEIALRCLEKDASYRFADAQGLKRALDACQCAGKWTQRRATQWWQDVQAS